MYEDFRRGRYIPDGPASSIAEEFCLSAYATRHVDINDKYADLYRDWIEGSEQNKVIGLDQFPYAIFSQGTTESFDKFYVRHKDKRVRVLRGEYKYHELATNVTFVDEAPLEKGDCLIISFPFADNGGDYYYHSILQACDELDIPVLVDCCWFGTCGGLELDFTYACIEDIVFSLSKTFPVRTLRIGIRLSRQNQDGLAAYYKDSYLNFFSQSVGMYYLKHFSSDYMYNKYRQKQLEICKELEVKASPTVIIATGDKKFASLNRGGEHNRLILSGKLIA